MTNAIPSLTQATQTILGANWTLIISVCAVSLTAMTAAISIFKSKKSINDDELRESNLIKDLSNTNKEYKINIAENSKEIIIKNDALKDSISFLKTEIEKIKVEMLNTNKSLEELRKDNRELVQRLDDLLKQLMDLIDR